ncbi:alpha/beta fold hydrolase [Sphingomonas sp. TDK1]|uniref:alpha/beta fold hydrolase n=1 Tax=Sphingomonas sp. TDK1 TaxID=453247 RepID=UPI0007D99040|nr:alpha/beta fold hydrolase [Sphingomonas sp. TDK1]OAN66670.1 3-oxoacyl-ACP reductase [Sphingomonas sp. TDK1]
MEIATHVYRTAAGYDISVGMVGEGPAVVFLHGSGPGASARSNFAGNIAAFVAAGFRVVLPDLIGYGASAKPVGIDYTLDLFAGTVRDALHRAGIERASLVGNSLGGGIALQIALEDPAWVDRLVLMAPGCVEERETYFAMPGIARMVGDFTSPDFSLEDQRRLVANLVYDPSVITDGLVAERYAVARTQPKDVLARMRTPNLAPRLGEIACPILGFWGADDAFCPASGAHHFLDACRDVRFMTFNRTGHWVQVERTSEFNAYTIGFLHG